MLVVTSLCSTMLLWDFFFPLESLINQSIKNKTKQSFVIQRVRLRSQNLVFQIFNLLNPHWGNISSFKSLPLILDIYMMCVWKYIHMRMYAYVPGHISMVQEQRKSSCETPLAVSLLCEPEGSDLVQYIL